MFHKIIRYSGLLFFAVGLILLYFLVQKFGIKELSAILHRLGWKTAVVLALPLTWNLAHTAGWYFAIEETGQHISFLKLLRIKLAGESVNALNPASFVVGDPYRLLLLRKKMPVTLGTASIVLDRTMQSLAILVMVLISLVVAWFTVNLPGSWRHVFPIVFILMSLSIALTIHRQKKGMFDSSTRLLNKLGIAKNLVLKLKDRIEVMDDRIAAFYKHNRKRFLVVLGFQCLGRLSGVIEIFMIAHFMHVPLSFSGALVLASLTVLVNIVFVFIPGSVGVLEGAYGALFHILGFSPVAGVAVQLIRRLRTLFWIFLGLLAMIPGTLKKTPAAADLV